MKSLVYGLLVLLFVGGGLQAKDGKLNTAANAGVVTVKGQVVRLSGGTNVVGFKSEDGVVYPLVRNQKSEALFVETNLAAKILIVKGRVQPKTHALEVTGNLYSWRNGKQHEIYYYCDICAIKTSEPGPCMCCREPVKLVEEP